MKPKKLTLTRAATLSGINRSTLGYWIRKGQLEAEREGNRYAIALPELIIALRAKGLTIPHALSRELPDGPVFRAVRPCWHFHGVSPARCCDACIVRCNHLQICFSASTSQSFSGSATCIECDYYKTIFLPRIEFIHQIDMPAAVYRDMILWGGNTSFARLCGRNAADLIGLGLEKIVHVSSLEGVLESAKKRAIGDPHAANIQPVFLKDAPNGRQQVLSALFPLDEPAAAFLAILNPNCHSWEA